MTLLLDSLFNGISIGTVLLIAALGLAIVFGLMGVINMAHGELMMLGAYTTFVVQNAFRQLGDPWRDLYIFPALVAAFVVTALVGLALERGVIRFLYGRPLETLLATWGVSLILQQFVRSVNWVLAFRLGAFAVLFFGGWWLLAKRADWPRLKGWVLMLLLVLSTAIVAVGGRVLAQTYALAVTQPWFGAQNRDVTAPRWLRGGIPVGNLFLPNTRLFIIALIFLCILGLYIISATHPLGTADPGRYPESGYERLCGDPYSNGGCSHLCYWFWTGRSSRRGRQSTGIRGAQYRTELHRGYLHGGCCGGCGQAPGQHCGGAGDRNCQLCYRLRDAGFDLSQRADPDRYPQLFCHHQHGQGDGLCLDCGLFAGAPPRPFPRKRSHGGCLGQPS